MEAFAKTGHTRRDIPLLMEGTEVKNEGTIPKDRGVNLMSKTTRLREEVRILLEERGSANTCLLYTSPSPRDS